MPLSDVDHMRWYLTEESFNQYLKERNINWQEYNERARQRVDSLIRSRGIEYQKIKEDREKKNGEQGLLRATQANNILTVAIENQRVRYESKNIKN